MFKKFQIIIAVLTLLVGIGGAFFSAPQIVFAQVDGLETVGETAGLQDTDPKIVVAKIIRVFLTTLGIIAVLIVIYGGFVWMTAGGDETKVEKAKKILINGTIGLIIILFSWAITTFIMTAILNATGTSSGGSGGGGSGGGGFGGIGGGASSFVVTEYRPEGEIEIRNVVLQMTFSRKVEVDSVAGNLSIVNSATDTEVDGVINVSGNKVTFTPSTPCPEPHVDRFCFDENTLFDISLNTDIESTTGTRLDCSSSSCTSSFTTGSLVDVDDPVAEISYPDDNVRLEPNIWTLIQVEASDDSQVAVSDFAAEDIVFDSVPATGDDLSNVIIETDWDNSGYAENAYYSISATVTDIAGNTDTDKIRVRINPIHCYNEVLDPDLGETGIDCGGDCGACFGASCEVAEDCSGGMCVDGLCSASPRIDAIEPLSGGPGTFVTISGEGFGRSGTVEFTSSTGVINAELASCAYSWTGEELIVEVPDGAIDGPITVLSGGKSDSTDDDYGPTILDFSVTEEMGVNLCRLSPSYGPSGTSVAATGSNFGDDQEMSQIFFDGGEVRVISSWSDDSLRFNVPVLVDGDASVRVVLADGSTSNPVSYTVTSSASSESESTPSISFVNPSEGGIGQYITISGNNLGSSIGSVWFEDPVSGYVALGSADFSEECSASFWSENEITIIVPSKYTNGNPIGTSTHNLYITRQDGSESNSITFNITTAIPSPGICAITPSSATVGEDVTIYGSGFGSSGSAVFYNEASASALIWNDNAVTVRVPSSSQTGPVMIESGGVESNSSNFEVLSESASVDDPVTAATYVWKFSTGEIPVAPEVIVECSDEVASAVPNSKFTKDVCVNAVVYAEFTMAMDPLSFIQGEDGSFRVEKCSNEGCSSLDPVDGVLKFLSDDSAVLWNPVSAYDPMTTYHVTITEDVTSDDGVPMERDKTWSFTTGDSSSVCEVETVRVSPNTETVTAMGKTAEFTAIPGTQDCIVLDSDDFVFTWTIDESYASAGDCDETKSSCMLATALAEGEAEVTSTELGSGIEGDGLFIIDFSDPYVKNYWPDCNTACINADIGAGFNTPMDVAIESSGMTSVYKCDNELCANLGPSDLISSTSSCVLDDDGDCTQISFNISGMLEANAFYKIVISGDNESTSGVALTRANDGDDFTWVFSTQEEPEVCMLERIEISPEIAEFDAVGEKQAFTLKAFGEADECSVAGQRLTATEYAWEWEDPIIDDSDIAEWFTIGGSLFDTDFDSVPDGCTSSCLATGSQSYSAICGNSSLEFGEDCDDGNVTDGDGCSSDCLNEGGGATCGDGIFDTGEECDDGNEQNGDGCSTLCLNEGSKAIGVICGNGSIGHATNLGGEECDDGNKRSGDGCSSNCLNEGSLSYARIDAICADGIVTTPFETCDDGNLTDGDGCSSKCLLEGSSTSYVVPSVCGDGILGIGEVDVCEFLFPDDGCSSNCLLKGSSTDYTLPSVCGDGAVGPGEDIMCEISASGDGDIDPVQVSEILSSAVKEVDVDTGFAIGTIRVEDLDYGISTEAEVRLNCVAQSASDCPDENLYGVANNGCCVYRPDVDLFPNGSNVCRNSSVYALFDTEMDTASFNGSAYIKLDLGVVGSAISCPDGYEIYSESSSVSWLQRTWKKIISVFFSSATAQADGDCILPISSFTQTKIGEDEYKVEFNVDTLMYPNTMHTIVIEGEDIFGEGGGVLSKLGVGMVDSIEQEFTTIADRCSLDLVEINDSSNAPGVFMSYGESHDFIVTPYSFATGAKQEISTVSGVYEWEWGDWQLSKEDYLTIDSQTDDESELSAHATGESTLAVEATVTVDSDGDDEGTDTKDAVSVSDGMNLEVFICDNPWPDYDDFPFIDNADGTVDGTSEGIGWMNFSTYYCRDQSQPSVTVIAPPESQTDEVIKEYLFKIDDGSGDAIGFRLATNEDYYSPMSWYKTKGFSGAPGQTTVDGFEAVRDGRTVYISAPNLDDDTSDIYSNMYVFSYNEGASETTINIFNQMIENLHIGTNIDDTAFCFDSGSLTETSCSSDFDCSGSEICGDLKAKITRDMKRLTDVIDIVNTLQVYGVTNKVCSSTTSQSCSHDDSCPGDETCESIYPNLSSGTYVRSIGVSAWSSWSDTLSTTLGINIPSDPLNSFDGCGANPYSDYEESTCVNQSVGQYICPVDSYTYHYRSLGPFSFELAAELEFEDGDWIYDIDDYDDFDILIGGNSSSAVSGFTGTYGYCDGSTVYGSSNTCGDGVVGSSEVCELGDYGSVVDCDSDGDGIDDGTISQVCASDCSAWEDDPAGTCTVYECGNGVIEDLEECDDGTANGRYGYCGYDCTYSSSFWCGDGMLAGGEVCDCGSTTVSGRTYGGGLCTSAGNLNGEYDFSSSNTCSWDCSGPSSYCGDGVVDSGEECDGDQDTYGGKLCSAGVSTVGEGVCESDSECVLLGFAGMASTTGTCGSTGSTKFDDCPTVKICLAGSETLLGYECSTDSDCDSSAGADGVCSTDTFETTRVRDCEDDGVSGDECTWSGDWEDIACRGAVLCGNGSVDDGEECDDGNDDSTDSCTAQCKVNICGDGYLESGVEECDEGSDNGAGCSSSYGSTCTYCSTSCSVVSASGTYCGDGEINGDEFCDAGDLNYYYVSSDATIYGSCDPANGTGRRNSTTDGTQTYYCTNIGVCNGGTEQGEVCASSSAVRLLGLSDVATCTGGGTCAYPTCTADCESSCPFSYEKNSLLMSSSGVSGNRSSVALESFADPDSLSSIKVASNSATVYFPACSTAKSVSANVSFSNLEYPTNYIVFVTDLSGSMGWTLSGSDTRLDVTQDVIIDAAEQLYDELDGYLEMTSFGYGGGRVVFPDGTIVSARDISSQDYASLDWFGDSESADFISLVRSYSTYSSTNTYNGLEAAELALAEITDVNVRKIVVLMTDGDYTASYGNPEDITCTLKADDIEVYTVALKAGTESTMQPDEDVCSGSVVGRGSSIIMNCSDGAENLSSIIDQMACYSSGNAHELTGVDYAFSGSTKSELAEMYDQILDSILGATFSFVVDGDLISDSIKEGNNVDLPWPEGFACEETSQEIPIRLYFEGEGTIGISNLKFEYCP